MARPLGFGIAAAAGLVLYSMPAPAGLSPIGAKIVAVAIFIIGLWVFQTMNNGVASVLMLALLTLSGVRPALALSGFSSPAWWVLLTVLFYGFAMQRTGLAQRVSLHILSLFPGTAAGILSASFAIGAALALGIPSMTVRTAIMTPIAWALAQSLGLARRSNGAALVVLTTVEMAVIPGCGLLYGSLFGPVVESVFRAKNLPLTWTGYAQALAPPTVLLCVLILAGNRLALPLEAPLQASREFVREKLRGLGPLSRAEAITAAVVILSIVYWATDRVHHMPSFLIGMIALGVFALTGIVKDQDIAGGVSWTLLLFMGGIFSLANVIQEHRITDWLATYFVPVARELSFSPALILIACSAATFLLRFLDPSGFIALAVLFLPIVEVTGAAGIPPLVLTASLMLASVPFWVTYQNIWVAMGEGITAGEAFSPGQRARLATVYGIAVPVTILASTFYWRWIGLL